MRRTNRNAVLAALLLVLTFFVLFHFRSADDNRLTSWQWTFDDGQAGSAAAIVVLVAILSFAISKAPVEKYNPSILFAAAYVISSIFWLEPEPIVDTSRYFTQAKHLEVYGAAYFIREWGREIAAWTDMPLVPFLYGLIFRFFGESRLYIQAFTTLLFSLTVLLTCKIGERLYGREAGLSAGTLLLGVPYLYTQAPLMLVDVPTMFFFTLAVFSFISALKSEGVAASFYSAVALCLAVFSKYSAWLMLTILPVMLAVEMIRDRERRRHMLCRGALVAVTTTLLVGLFFLYKYDVFSEQIKLLMSYQRAGLRRWGESFISTFFFQIHPWISAAAAYSAYIAVRKRDVRHLMAGYLVFLVILLQIRRIRYVIMIFPMLMLMASYALQEMRNRELRKYIISCITVSSLALSIFVYLPFVRKISAVNLQEAGRFVNGVGASNIEVYAITKSGDAVNQAVSVPVFDLFTDRDICYRNDNAIRPPEDVMESSLRFTWEYRNPGYYRESCKNTDERTSVVLILNEENEVLPESVGRKIAGYVKYKTFRASEGVFEHQTIVKVFYR